VQRSQGYSYDGFGNLYAKTGTGAGSWAGTLNSETNRLKELRATVPGGSMLAWTDGNDEAGYLKYGDALNTMITWDARGRMLTDGQSYYPTSYRYDSANQRILRSKQLTDNTEMWRCSVRGAWCWAATHTR
jgi:hypothetical protein